MGLQAAALLLVPTSDTAYKVMMSVKCFMIDSNYYKWSCYDDKGYRVCRITSVTVLLPIRRDFSLHERISQPRTLGKKNRPLLSLYF